MESTKIIINYEPKIIFNIFKEIEVKIFDNSFILNKKDPNLINIILQLKHNNNLNKINYNEEDLFKNDIYINKNYYYDLVSNKLIFKGYPTGNLLFLILNNIYICYINKSNVFSFFDLKEFNKTEINCIELLDFFIKNNTSNNFNLLLEKTFNELEVDAPRIILTLLGIRKTAGSINNYIPIEKILLFNCFTAVNNAKSKLTVGARALCKHSHRSITEKFWPSQEGKENEKNENSLKMLNLFFNECIWINIHGLPHNIGTIELRENKGYGIRWQFTQKNYDINENDFSCDLSFRGFLEPQMEDGHTKGWIH